MRARCSRPGSHWRFRSLWDVLVNYPEQFQALLAVDGAQVNGCLKQMSETKSAFGQARGRSEPDVVEMVKDCCMNEPYVENAFEIMQKKRWKGLVPETVKEALQDEKALPITLPIERIFHGVRREEMLG